MLVTKMDARESIQPVEEQPGLQAIGGVPMDFSSGGTRDEAVISMLARTNGTRAHCRSNCCLRSISTRSHSGRSTFQLVKEML